MSIIWEEKSGYVHVFVAVGHDFALHFTLTRHNQIKAGRRMQHQRREKKEQQRKQIFLHMCETAQQKPVAVECVNLLNYKRSTPFDD